jgi:uncharacterized Fe-S cluster-containing radical SAM superfamily protein
MATKFRIYEVDPTGCVCPKCGCDLIDGMCRVFGHNEVPVRFVNVRGAVYLRAEDVVMYLQEMAAAEETDTRNRIRGAAEILAQSAKKHG